MLLPFEDPLLGKSLEKSLEKSRSCTSSFMHQPTLRVSKLAVNFGEV